MVAITQADDSPEAARLARECTAITQALTLAHWIAGKPRPVTPGEVLRKADVGAAGAQLGIAVPAKLAPRPTSPSCTCPG